MRGLGYEAQVTERWNPYGRVRIDLYGFIDVLCVGNGETIGVQTTSYSNVSKRVAKINVSPILPKLKEAGWKIVVHGWRKVKNRYKLREVEI